MQRGTARVEEAGWRNRALVRERDERRVRWLWHVFFGIVIALLPVGAHRYIQNAHLLASFELNELRTETTELIEEERRLNMERSRLEALSRIESWANKQPDLIQPDPRDVHVVHRYGPGDGDLLAGVHGPARVRP